MTVISLTNPGLIPIEAVTTMGVSAKEGENPIGFFGTGLKYAVACLLRTSQKITIFRGLERYDFETFTDTVRGKEFQFINMREDGGDPVRLGFTTHLGAHWEPWQVFRELYSNCLDEGGELSFAAVEPSEGHTTIRVTGEAFADAARDRGRYFLNTKPVAAGILCDVHPGPSNAIYYRGVMVAPLSRPARFTYNLTTAMTLTEDRTLRDTSSGHAYIAHALANCRDKAVIERAMEEGAHFEASLSIFDPCEVFAETVLAMCERKGLAAVSPNAAKAAETWAQREARVAKVALTLREEREIGDAKAFLRRMGYPITAPVSVVETLGPDVFGMAKNQAIYIARVTLNRGGNFLIGTLLEEQLHLTHGFLDESRRFQDFLIDLVVKLARDADRSDAPPIPIPPPKERVLEPEEALF